MTRDDIKAHIDRIFRENFEIEDPDFDEDLREAYEFDSIDAIELLREIELMLGTVLSRAEKEDAMHIRTINQIIEYIEALARSRSGEQPVSDTGAA